MLDKKNADLTCIDFPSKTIAKKSELELQSHMECRKLSNKTLTAGEAIEKLNHRHTNPPKTISGFQPTLERRLRLQSKTKIAIFGDFFSHHS